MAQKDKKTWLKLFYSKWGYKPTRTIRKDKRYQEAVSFDEGFMRGSDINSYMPVHVIFPFEQRPPFSKEAKDSVVIFPQIASSENEIWEIDKPILHDERFYSLDDFISECPEITDNAEHSFGTFTFSLEYFMLSAKEADIFKKLYFPAIRKTLLKSGIWDEARGKGRKSSKILKDRNQTILMLYRTLGKQDHLNPEKNTLTKMLKAIHTQLGVEALQKNLTDGEKKEFVCSKETIRRVLKLFTKK